MDTGARDDNFTERINLVLDWRIQALGLLGVSRSKVSSDEPDGLCGSSCTAQLYRAKSYATIGCNFRELLSQNPMLLS